jgi:large subunit ribosomal protein L5
MMAQGAKTKREKEKTDVKASATEPRAVPRLRERFREAIAPALMKQFRYKNIWQVPRPSKIVINMGLGEAVANVKVIDAAVEELSAVTGQKPVVTRAKKSEAGFKLRTGVPIGCKVTLRGDRMYEFLDRFVNIALPRIRDFRGVPAKSFDGRGNYNLGVREQLIFPEIKYDKVDAVRGMDIAIETSARTDEQARALLEHLGFPFQKS